MAGVLVMGAFDRVTLTTHDGGIRKLLEDDCKRGPRHCIVCRSPSNGRGLFMPMAHALAEFRCEYGQAFIYGVCDKHYGGTETAELAEDYIARMICNPN